jgi:hypothetical protein
MFGGMRRSHNGGCVLGGPAGARISNVDVFGRSVTVLFGLDAE